MKRLFTLQCWKVSLRTLRTQKGKERTAFRAGASADEHAWRTHAERTPSTCTVSWKGPQGYAPHRLGRRRESGHVVGKRTCRAFLRSRCSSVFWMDSPPTWLEISSIRPSNTLTTCGPFQHVNTRVGALKTYKHSKRRLKLNVPNSWKSWHTFGKIFEKHWSSSSERSMWGRNMSVIIFSTPGGRQTNFIWNVVKNLIWIYDSTSGRIPNFFMTLWFFYDFLYDSNNNLCNYMILIRRPDDNLNQYAVNEYQLSV